MRSEAWPRSSKRQLLKEKIHHNSPYVARATIHLPYRFLPRDVSRSFYKLLKTFIFARAWAGSASAPLSSYLHSFIHSGHFHSAPSSPLPLRGAPDYNTDTVSEFHAEAHKQLQVKDLPKVLT